MSDTFNLDALEVDESGEPFTFTYKDETYTMPLIKAMPWQDQVRLEICTTEDSLRIILGEEQFDKLGKVYMSTARMGALVEAWKKYQGIKPGE